MKTIKILLIALVALGSTSVMAQQKFGTVSAQEILTSMAEKDSVDAKLNALRNDWIAQIDANEKEYTAKMQEFQKNQGTYSATILEQKKKDITALQERMQQAAQAAEKALQEEQTKLLEPLQKKLIEAITKVGKTGGYAFVFAKGAAVYVSETLVTDVTALVKAELKLK